MRFTDLTYEELRELTPETVAVFVPLGCTEQQGPHMSVGFDSLMVTRLCEDIALGLERDHEITTLLMPTLPFGPTPEHAGFGHGYVNLRQSTHEAVVEDILESLAQQGFRRLLIWRGCGQHELGDVVKRFNVSHEGPRAYQPLIDYGRVSAQVLANVPGGHADSFATSICLLLDETGVRPGLIRKPRNEPFEWSDQMDFAAISDSGVIGDPTRASRGAGQRIWQMCVEEGVQIVLDILAGRPVRESRHFKPWRSST